ncbi:MAG TPA: hypothetical protein PK867_31030, partial [Pirellulales bacterium]|nr:hypothetical protein [Pirellulales bacterium]
MSTVPHDPSHATDAAHAAPVFAPASYQQKVDEAVSEFESGAYWLGIPRPPTAELREICRKVAAYTAEIFPGEMRIKVRNDPEITDDLYFVFEVVCDGDV